MAAIMATDRAKWARLFRRHVAGVMGDVLGGRDGAPCPFGYRAVMTACTRAHDRFGVAGPICQRRGASAALPVAACGVTGGVAPQVL
jgi:hypothetical protein